MQQDEVASGLPGAPHWAGIAADGLLWTAFRKQHLAPRYWVVWRDIALCYVLIVGGLAALAAVEARWGLSVGLALSPLFALFVGFWLHSLSNFGHEAAHYNLAPSRRLNDRAADWLVWPLFSQTVKNYRKLHWEHHRHLGDQQDTETSYHNCLSPWFLLKTLSGVYLLESLLRYTRTNRRLNAGTAGEAKPTGGRFGLLRTAALHAAILALLVEWGFWATASAWVLCVAVTFPCFATLRQVLEHRRLDASCDQDFKQIAHSPVNRMFGTGWLASSFGTAGFNRHLLHHWDPGVSYTRFDEMEAFLMRTTLAPQIDAARSGYLRTLSQLVGKGWSDVR